MSMTKITEIHATKAFKLFWLTIIGTAISLLPTCGSNVYKELESPAASKEASVALEKDDPAEAKNVILAALGDTYNNTFNNISSTSDLSVIQTKLSTEMVRLMSSGEETDASNLVSILASAQAQEFGVDVLSIALKLALEGGDSTNPLYLLFPILPDATSANIHGLDVAVTLIRSVGSKRTEIDLFKESLFTTSAMSLALKSADADGDGSLSASEIANLTDEGLGELMGKLAKAAISAAAFSADSTSNQGASAAVITELESSIDSQDGADSAAKLRAFLSEGAE